MPDFLLRDLDPDLMERLRARATLNGRSLQAEIHSTLRDSFRLSKAESIKLIRKLQAESAPSSDSTPLIREFRDS